MPFDDTERIKQAVELQKQALALHPPPIPFKKKKEKEDKKDKGKDDPSNLKSIDLKLDPDNPDSETITKKIRIFEDGSPEDWITWKTNVDEVIRDSPLLTASARIKATLVFLKGRARAFFQSNYAQIVAENSHREPEEQWSSLAIYEGTTTEEGKAFFL